MDPVTAVGLASAIIGFVPLGIKLLQNIREVKGSVDGTLEQNRTRQAVAEEMQAISGRLQIRGRDHNQLPPEQTKLYELAGRCHELSQKILIILDKVQPKPQTASKYRSGFRVWRKESEIKELEKGLSDCRDQLLLGLVDLSK